MRTTALATRTRKNIYVRAEDVDIWTRAEQMAGESLSQLVADQLRAYVTEREAKQQGLERLVVEVQRDNGTRKVAFYGRWLTDWISDGDMLRYRAAVTRRGAIALTTVNIAWGHEEVGVPLGEPPQLNVYASLQEADKAGIPAGVLDQAAKALDVELIVEELDI